MTHDQTANRAQKADASTEAPDARTQTGPQHGDTAEGSRPLFARTRAVGRTVWRATLGAAVTVEHRTARFFNRMVEKGARYQSQRARDHSGDDQAHSADTAARPSAVERLQHLEHSIEDRLDKGRDNTLHWMGVPSRKDFAALEQKIEELTRALEEVQAQRQPRASSGRRQNSRAKTAAH